MSPSVSLVRVLLNGRWVTAAHVIASPLILLVRVRINGREEWAGELLGRRPMLADSNRDPVRAYRAAVRRLEVLDREARAELHARGWASDTEPPACAGAVTPLKAMRDPITRNGDVVEERT